MPGEPVTGKASNRVERTRHDRQFTLATKGLIGLLVVLDHPVIVPADDR